VTIVIPTRNRCHLLGEAIASVRAQTFVEWELIVVDDASEDETWPRLQDLRDPRIRTIRFEERAERSEARNAGLRVANAPLILFLDDDDLLPARALHAHVVALQRHPAAIASIGGYVMFDGSGSRRTYRIVRSGRLREIFKDVLFGWMAISGQCLLRTGAVRSVNGWDGDRIPIEDHDLWLRLGRVGPVVLLPDQVLMYRIHRGQWRPKNLHKMMTEVREQAVLQTHVAERSLADRVLGARSLAQKASKHYRRSEAGRALLLYLRAIRLAPSLLRSPLTRPMIVVPMMTCLAGNIGLRIGRPLVSRMRRALKREIKGSVRRRSRREDT
jgi:glycosyltransferase involved in cell wall biosynthesis